MLNSATSPASGFSILEKSTTGSYIGAIAACPFYQDTCSTVKGSSVTSVIGTTDQSVTLENYGDSVALKIDTTNAGAGDVCTWVVKATCGAPSIQIDNSDAASLTANEIDVWVLEYSEEFTSGASTPITLTGQTNVKAYYPKDKAVSVYPDPSKQEKNVPPSIEFKPFDGVNIKQSVPGWLILEWKDTLKTTYDQYAKTKAAYDAENIKWTEYINGYSWNISKPYVPETPPSMPDNFPLVTGSKAEPITLGYGYPSSTALDFTSKGRSWGVYQSSKALYNSTEIQQSVRKTKQPDDLKGCDASYVMVQAIYKTSTSGLTKLTLNVTSNAFNNSLSVPANPTPATKPLSEPTGATILKVLASAIFALVYLM